jgi:ribosomal protein S6
MSAGMTVGSLRYFLGLTTLLMLFLLVEVYWSYQTKGWVKLVDKLMEGAKESIEDVKKSHDFAEGTVRDYEKLARKHLAYMMHVSGDPEGAIAIQTETDKQVIEKMVAEMQSRLEEILRQNGKLPKGRPKGSGTYSNISDFVAEVTNKYAMARQGGKSLTQDEMAHLIGCSPARFKQLRKEAGDTVGFKWPPDV